jgi:lysozyme
MMKTSPNGRAFITRHEGEILKVYADPVGIKTAGVGHTGPEVDALPLGTKITKKQSQGWLEQDLREAEEGVNSLVKVELSQEMFDALVSLFFNIGRGNFMKSTLLKKLNREDYNAAASEFPRWSNARGKKLPGLVRRRMEEQAMFLRGIDQEDEHESNVEADYEAKAPSPFRSPAVQTTGAVTTAALLNEQADKISALAPYSEYMTIAFIALTILALIYAFKAKR